VGWYAMTFFLLGFFFSEFCMMIFFGLGLIVALERLIWSTCLVLCRFRLSPSRLTLASGVPPDRECGQLPPGALPL